MSNSREHWNLYISIMLKNMVMRLQLLIQENWMDFKKKFKNFMNHSVSSNMISIKLIEHSNSEKPWNTRSSNQLRMTWISWITKSAALKQDKIKEPFCHQSHQLEKLGLIKNKWGLSQIVLKYNFILLQVYKRSRFCF